MFCADFHERSHHSPNIPNFPYCNAKDSKNNERKIANCQLKTGTQADHPARTTGGGECVSLACGCSCRFREVETSDEGGKIATRERRIRKTEKVRSLPCDFRW